MIYGAPPAVGDFVSQGGAPTVPVGLDPMPGDETLDQMPASGMLWGQRADGDLGRLMQDAATLDAARAQGGRSHWWVEAGQGCPAHWPAVTGLPGVGALHWLLVEARADAGAAQETDDALWGRVSGE